MLKICKTKRFLLTTISVCALCATGQSFAQPAQPAQGGVEELTVTAQKRSENLQVVPIAITAISANTAQALGIKDTIDIQVATPGLIMHHQTNAMTPVLRGITTANAAPGDESPIAVYVDGVYFTAMSSGVFSLNNIERVEVLKGPQGTLFGRNAVGGVINVITKMPEQTPQATISLGYGNYNTPDVSVYGTTGITPEIATDLAFHYHQQFEGFGVHTFSGERDTFETRDFAVRSKTLFTPSDKTQIVFSANYEDSAEPMGVAEDPLPGTFDSFGGTHKGGFYDLRGNVNANDFYTEWAANIHVTQDLDWARLVSISAYNGATPLILSDSDYVEVNAQRLYLPIDLKELTQEFQILSPEGSKVKWIGGLFLLENTVHSSIQVTGTAIGPAPAFRAVVANLLTDSAAAFGEVTVPIFEDTSITGGLRYTIDLQKIEGGTYSTAGVAPSSIVGQKKIFDKPTWRFDLEHQFTPDLMTYVSYNRGFKSGVFNSSAPSTPAVRPEVIDAYEAGVKSQWLNDRLRLNASVFDYQVNQVQISVTVVPGTNQLLNAAKASIQGTDMDAEVIPFERLTLRSGVSYVDSHYKDFFNAPINIAKPAGGYLATPGNGSDNWLIFTPKWTFNVGAQYYIPTEHGTYGFSVINYFNGAYYPDPGNQFRQSPYDLVNASIDWTSPDEKWMVRLWGKNLADAKYLNQFTVNATAAVISPSPPLTYGITLTLKLGGT